MTLGETEEFQREGYSCIVTLEVDAHADVVQRNMSVTASSAETEFWVSRLESRTGGRLGAQ